MCCRVKTAEQEKRKTETLLDDARKQITRLQAANEERINAFKRLQKRLLLVSYVSVCTRRSVIGRHRVTCFRVLVVFLVLRRMIMFRAACDILALSL